MTYVISDIHGEYKKFLSMLELIDFRENDNMYIIGDCVDRGPEPIKLLLDLSKRSNIYPIVGNHELMALDMLDRLLVEITDDNYDSHIDCDTLLAYSDWMNNGGDVTVKQFKELDREKRFALMDYLKDFAPYETVDTNDKTFILVHAGLGNYKKEKRLREYTLSELCDMRPDYGRRYFDDEDIYMICGHTPTLAVTGKAEIYHSANNILIDCGAAFGGRLACLRLEDMKEFYI